MRVQMLGLRKTLRLTNTINQQKLYEPRSEFFGPTGVKRHNEQLTVCETTALPQTACSGARDTG